ncbi:Asp-tRNA(Asn)/Glu-tRNA(Gln) amidotransferase subunit GatB [Nanoarchaeota archaeon]
MIKIGLEIHAYLNTKEKLFCNCKAEHGLKFSKPNTNICPICTGQPGAKPMLPNSEAIKKVIQIALILGCKINTKLIWQRKHYDWADSPKGYQNTISGPYATENAVKGKFSGIKITECHLEEDPAAWNPKTGEIDYNRSGSPLIEIVTDPDFTSIDQVTIWLKELITTLNYIKAIDKKSGIKADVNISLPPGKRVEIKNINSLQNIKSALEYEIQRQKKDPVKEQHTRMFDSEKRITKLMRTKENAEDYRFISDPDLPTINIKQKQIDKFKNNIPKIPSEKLKELIKIHKIEKKYAEILIKNIDLVEFSEKVLKEIKPKIALPWITVKLLGALNYNKKFFDETDITAEHFIELLKLIENKSLTELKAQEIMWKFIPKSFSPKKQAEKNKKISSEEDLIDLAKKVIKEFPKAVEDYKSGKIWSINFMVGQIMKLTNKRADFKVAKKLFEDLLR